MDADALVQQGSRFHQSNLLADAEACYRRALAADPHHPDALHLLGLIAHASKHHDAAIELIERALRSCPDEPLFRTNLAVVLRSLGLVRKEERRYAEAVALYERALEIRPGVPEWCVNLGVANQEWGRFDEAADAYGKALAARPDDADAWYNLGTVNMERCNFDGAMVAFDHALKSNPAHAAARFARGQLRLLRGDFAGGWLDYESRPLPELRTATPRWDGSIVAGRTLLVMAEQGLGDTIQFARFVPPLARCGMNVVFAVQQPLVTLFCESPGFDAVVAREDKIGLFDAWCPLLSLPRLLDLRESDIPPTPYLPREVRPPGKERRVGIVWRGNPRHARDDRRSVPVESFAALACDGVTLVNLQRGPDGERLDEGVPFPFVELVGECHDFADLRRVMETLDLLVTVDTAPAHLAGAMGVPVWLATPASPDWRWLLGRDDSPWYPSMRLFRQDRPGEWRHVFDRMRSALRDA